MKSVCKSRCQLMYNRLFRGRENKNTSFFFTFWGGLLYLYLLMCCLYCAISLSGEEITSSWPLENGSSVTKNLTRVENGSGVILHRSILSLKMLNNIHSRLKIDPHYGIFFMKPVQFQQQINTYQIINNLI